MQNDALLGTGHPAVRPRNITYLGSRYTSNSRVPFQYDSMVRLPSHHEGTEYIQHSYICTYPSTHGSQTDFQKWPQSAGTCKHQRQRKDSNSTRSVQNFLSQDKLHLPPPPTPLHHLLETHEKTHPLHWATSESCLQYTQLPQYPLYSL